jgi:hypothetical protein
MKHFLLSVAYQIQASSTHDSFFVSDEQSHAGSLKEGYKAIMSDGSTTWVDDNSKICCKSRLCS